MRWVIAAIVFAIPLAFAPGVFFYYDVTPKAAAVLAGASILLLWAALKPKTSVSFMTCRFGRWNAALTAAFILLTILTAKASPVLSLAWNGSNWRRWGAVEQIATVVCAFLVAALARSSPGALVTVLRGLCAAGVVAALYGIAQYFGFDPFIPAVNYVVGEGRYQIVRPPGPLGHGDYFAVFLSWPVFAGIGLWITDSKRARWLGGAAVLAGIIALVLAGSRGAGLGLAFGLATLAVLYRPRMRTVTASLVIFATVAAAFYVSPAGARLRARAFWISEDPAGGARLLLWRDTLRMSASWKGITGFGPENFVAEFPQFQSVELARAYPDFSHESPHNMFLDALSGQGGAGVVLLAGWVVLGIAAGLRAPPGKQPMAAALLAGLAASVVAQQFVVFIVPTAFLFYLGVGLLTGLEPEGEPKGPRSISRPLRPAIALCGVAAAVFLAVTAYRLVAADLTLARIRKALDAGDTRQAAVVWESAKSRRSAGVTADLYFSRRWAAAASAAHDPLDKIRLGALAIEATRLATTDPEQRQNAWYNFAILSAALQDTKAVESSLRSAIAAGPNWFKPHWALARLLYSDGRTEEARKEANLALDLDGGKDPEVIRTTAEIVRSLDSRR